jgi:hypothetical protein
MNMISTGAFQTEMDASNKQLTLSEKFAAVWEKKNAKAARAGGVSLMALSLAACGSDDDTTATTSTSTDTTTTTTTTTPVVSDPFNLTPLSDTASSTMAANGTLTSTFRFTTGDETVNGISATMHATNDVLIDPSTTDSDTLSITGTGATAITTVNIENVALNAASGTVNLNAANLTGVTSVSVNGSVASTVDNVSAAATIKSDGYGRVLTVDDTNYDGTTAALNPDTLNLEISGGTFGTTAATQSGFSLITDNASTIETLNVTSSGTAANVYSLDASTNVTMSTVNFLGATDATARVAHADVTGLTLVGTAATGDVNLRVDMNGTGAALNATSFSGIDNFLMADSTVTGDAASITGLADGQKVTIVDDMDATTFTVSGAGVGSEKAAITVVLDNETASVDLDVANITIDNVKTLNLESSGYSTSTATTSENSTGTVDGDFTTITITGDTSLDTVLDIDAGGTAETTARTVTVDASANTKFVTIDAVDDKYVGYNITGTAGNDTLKLNETAGTITAGAGNDTISLSGKNDTVDAGAGNDTINATNGTDTITTGTGTDTIIMGEMDVTAVVQSVDLTPAGGMDGPITIVIDGSRFTEAFDTNVASTLDNFITTHSASIIANTNVTAITDGASKLTFTGDSTTTELVISGTSLDSTAVEASTIANTASVQGVSVNTKLVDFDAGTATSGGDVLSFSVSAINAILDDLSDSNGDVVADDAVVVQAYAVGTALATTDIDAGANVLIVNYTTAVNAVGDVTTAVDASNIVWDNAQAATDGVVTLFYDADDAKAVFGIMQQDGTDGATWDDGITFNALGEMTMSSTDYALLDATNFSFTT